jgi:ferritin-like metal-binding protein YciE
MDRIPEQTKRDSKLVEMLNEAYGKERQLEVALASHLEVTTRDDYEKALRQHLKETTSHASAVAKRIEQLGGAAETASGRTRKAGPKQVASRRSSTGKPRASKSRAKRG